MGRSTLELKAKPRTRSTNSGLPEGFEQLMMQQSDNSRIVMLHGDVNEHSIANVINQLLQLAAASKKPIYLVVSTYGGSIDEMFSLYDTIKFLPCPVHTIGLGKVMSAGVLLLSSGSKGKRMIGRAARVMMHPVSGGVIGNVFEILNESKEAQRLHNLMIDMMLKETKMTRDQLDNIMKVGYDFYLTAEQAIELGIVDKIIGDDNVKV